jgi:hypothetical protein
MKSAVPAVLGVAALAAALLLFLPLGDCPCCAGLAAGLEDVCVSCRDTGRAPWRAKRPAECGSWPSLMADLRPGGGFDDLQRPEGRAFARVKAMGPVAYPHLARYIDHEDVALGRAAVAVLNALTGRNAPLPASTNGALRRRQWEAWIRTLRR